MKRDSMVFYRSFHEAIQDLPDDMQAGAYRAVLDYAMYGIEPASSGVARAVFKLMKPQVDANNRKWARSAKGRAELARQAAEREEPEPPVPDAAPGKRPVRDLLVECSEHADWLAMVGMKNSMTAADALRWLRAFALHLVASGRDDETMAEFKRYFANWCASEIRQGRQPVNAPPPGAGAGEKLPPGEAMSRAMAAREAAGPPPSGMAALRARVERSAERRRAAEWGSEWGSEWGAPPGGAPYAGQAIGQAIGQAAAPGR